MAAQAHCVMFYMTIAAQDSIQHSTEYEPKQFLTWGSDSMCLGEIRKFASPSQLAWNVLSVISINMA